MVETVAEVAGKETHKKYIGGPVGVRARNFSKARIHSLGWEAKVSLKEGIARTYPWMIEAQIKAQQTLGVRRRCDDRCAGGVIR